MAKTFLVDAVVTDEDTEAELEAGAGDEKGEATAAVVPVVVVVLMDEVWRRSFSSAASPVCTATRSPMGHR